MSYKNVATALSLLLIIFHCFMQQSLHAQNAELPHLRSHVDFRTDGPAFSKMLDSLKKWGMTQEDSATRVMEGIYNYCLKNNNVYSAIMTQVAIAVIRMDNGRYTVALKRLNEALELCKTNPGNEKALAPIYVNIGNVHNYMADYKSSASAYFTALDYYNKYPNQSTPRSYIYNNLAGTLFRLNQTEKAMQIMHDAYNEAVKEGDSVFMANVQMNIGSCYFMQKDYQKSEQYYLNAIALSNRIKAYDKHYLSLLGLGNIYMKQSRYDLALEYLEEAHQLMSAHTVKQYGKNYMLSLIAEVYVHKKDYKKAQLYYKQAMEDTNKTLRDSIYILAKQAELHYAIGDYKKAYDYKDVYQYLSDSISNKEIARSVSELDAKYRSAEKDKEIFEAKLLLSEQKVKLNNKNLWILGISSFTLILVVIGGAWVIYRSKKNKIISNVIKLQSRIEGEEQERIRISHELHDGVNSQLTAVKSFMIAAQGKLAELRYLDEFNTAKEILSEAATEVRNIAHNLAPDNLLRTGLIPVVATFCEKLFTPAGIKHHVDSIGDFNAISPELALTIYRIIQELCNNIVKHARADHATIILTIIDNQLNLIVEDNGVGISGIDTQKWNGIGIKGIRERVELFKGVMQVESVQGSHTTFNISWALGNGKLKVEN